MNAFHEYLSKQLEGHLKKRRVVVWYDPNDEFTPYVEELLTKGTTDGELAEVPIGELRSRLAQFEGSYFGLRLVVELEKAGHCYEPQLKRLARNVMREKYTKGAIDEMLEPESVTYGDVVQLMALEGGSASLLKAIFTACADDAEILAMWLASDTHDEAITSKGASAELSEVIGSRLGLDLDPDREVAEARARTARYVLVNEFLADLSGAPPTSTAMMPRAPSKDHQHRIEDVAQKLRSAHADAYVGLADDVESDLGLSIAELGEADLGSTDTFRFEEQALLRYCDELIAAKEYANAMAVVEGRGRSFWVDRSVARHTQWQACRLMAELGQQTEAIAPAIEKMKPEPSSWVEAYAGQDGWHVADLTHRRLEAMVAKMDEDAEASRGLVVVRSEHDRLLRSMATGFSAALQRAKWTVSRVLPQTRVFCEKAESAPGRTAYFLVDSLRFEMGAELLGQMPEAQDASIVPAMAALPAITAVGMGALMPGAASSFSVVQEKGEVAARVEGTSLPGVAARRKWIKAKAPESSDLTLGRSIQDPPSKVRRAIGEASLIVVRSQEIDAVGEGGDSLLARQVMDTIVGNVTRGVRKLGSLGIEHFVITADHGHLFAEERGEDMKTDDPGGDKVELHRRCWVGRGGQPRFEARSASLVSAFIKE